MSQTALHPWLALPEARIGPYHGVETALSFGSPAAELEALRSGCGVFALPWRAQVGVSGKDRMRWLHNMVTNNVRDLGVNRGNYNFVLNAQGRILGDLYIYNRGESLLLESDSTQMETLLTTLKRFIIMDKVELAPMGTEKLAFGICGPKSTDILSAAGISQGALEPNEVRDVMMDGLPALLIAGPAKKPFWFEIWVDAAHAQEVWSKLGALGARPVGAEALEMWRVLRGIPHYGQDIRDRDLPQETGQADALNFTKGCYIGQEIVERIRSRGHVHRQFKGFQFPGNPPSLENTEADRRSAVELTSMACVPAKSGSKNIGLGYVRQEVLGDRDEIEVRGITARVVELPFDIEEEDVWLKNNQSL
jgi:folate-binding protein YgfZ